MTEDIREIQEREINTYRIRVHCLSQELWETTQQPNRINIMIQLADAVTSLLHLENNAFGRSEAEQKDKS
jgi:hypothetical protein